MSRQSKNAKKRTLAKQFSEQRKSGGSGPKRTTTKHGKNPERRLYTTKKRPTTDSSGRSLGKDTGR
jgi:hypothetical protein